MAHKTKLKRGAAHHQVLKDGRVRLCFRNEAGQRI
jgi:hypothetical protein